MYPLRPEGLVRWFAIDVDKQDPACSVRVLSALCNLGLNVHPGKLSLADLERLLRICDLAHRMGRRALGWEAE